jgi:hypothetical protein
MQHGLRGGEGSTSRIVASCSPGGTVGTTRNARSSKRRRVLPWHAELMLGDTEQTAQPGLP